MNENNLLDCIEIETSSPAKRSIIWLHGLGADGNDFAPITTELNLPTNSGLRFIFPHAPIMPVTINNGYEMRAWFDIYGFSFDSRIDTDGIAQSVRHVERLIKREVDRGIDNRNIILAGFSQGAAIALTTGLSHATPLCGVIALSGFLPLAGEVLSTASSANRQLPIFLAHGTEDPIVPYALGKATQAALTQAGYNIDWHSYPMPHSVCAEEIHDIGTWLKDIIAGQKKQNPA